MPTTDTATQATTALAAAASLRAALAWVALQDAPTPSNINLWRKRVGHVDLTVETLDELHVWAELVGGVYSEPFAGSGTLLHSARATAGDWLIRIDAHIPVDSSTVVPLDDATREQLAAVVGAQ